MSISRRTILVSALAAGGGLVVWDVGRRLNDGDAAAKFAASTPESVGLNAWVKIDREGAVTCGVHRAEMGQGVTTALPMLLAEELDVDWERVRFEFTPVDRDYRNFGLLLRGRPLGDTAGRPMAQAAERVISGAFHALGISMTVGSTSMVDAWDTLRPAGAAARALLLAAAARRWGVPVAGLETLRGQVVDRDSGRSAGYGELASDAVREQLPDNLQPKDPAAFRLVGTSPARLDVPAKVTGAARFGTDTVQPGMLFATLRHSPLVGTRIAAVDNAAEVSGMPGIEGVVRLGTEAVAVVARDTWSAMRGAARLSLKPDPADMPSPDGEAIIATWRQALDDADPAVFREAGNAPDMLAGNPAALEAVYELPWLAHLCMEPMSCAALVEPGGVTVWAPTQAESIARDAAANVAGVGKAEVTVHRTFLGGGFGRRSETDFVSHAVGAAKAFPGRAVKLMYTREEDVRADRFRPAAVARIRGVLDQAGRVQAMDYVIVSQSVIASYASRNPLPVPSNPRKDQAALSGAADLIYSGIPNLRFAFVPREVPVPAGFWRSVGNSHNGFIVESFMDELAAAARSDPVEFRLLHLTDRPAHQAVLREAARRSGWGTPLAAGRGRGVALIESNDSIVAQVVEVTVGEGDDFRVDRVVCVIDPRIVVHPDIVVAQMEGGIIDGLAAALHGRITISGGGVDQSNFDNYPPLRLADAPAIDVYLLPQGGRPGGVGEPGVPAVAPAIANALYAATGRRVRTLPFRPIAATPLLPGR